ncbi:glycosyltransferase family 4 protein [Neorhizobium sp. NPDC001467]|uniref:glycosyltransferase family 4 protein n=1 Tax=Neorhizobium sp. NPDC001467 TaxID=3390595 RepID=UPI003D077240
MQIHHFFSHDYEQKTGGWIYNRRLTGWVDRHFGNLREMTVPACFPSPEAAVLAQIAAMFDAVEAGAVLVMDHVYACMLLPILSERPFKLVLIYHHSLSEERGQPQAAADRDSIERSALELAHLVIVTSKDSCDYVTRHHGVAADRVITAQPGNDPVPQSPAHGAGAWQLLSVGAVIPRKRYEFLVEAMATLLPADANRGARRAPSAPSVTQDAGSLSPEPLPGWRLTIVGNTERYPDYVAELRDVIETQGLGRMITLAGELPAAALETLWGRTHLYVASSFYEGYGMAISEAICRGVPVLSTPSGAVAGWAAQAVTLVDAQDPRAMAAAIAAIIADPALYGAARKKVARQAVALPSWEENLARVGEGLRRLA